MNKAGVETLETMATADWYNNWLFSFIKPHIKGEILEVGVGIGNFIKMLSKRGRVTAIDVNKDYIKMLKDKKLVSSVGYGDVEKGRYFFGDKKFDSIVCLNVVEHIRNDKKAVSNMNKLLKKGGKLILLIPAHNYLFSNFDKELGHFRRYSKKEVAELIENSGFENIDVRYINWWGAIGWFVLLKLTGRKDMPRPPVKIFDLLARILLLPEKLFRVPFGLSIIAIAEKK